MQYHLRCNRFREYAEKGLKAQPQLSRPQNPISNIDLALPIQRDRRLMATPERPHANNRARPSQQKFIKLASAIADPEADRAAFPNELSSLTEIKRRLPERAISTPKENTSCCMSESSASSKKRKSHFLTVVSRLPGMSCGKKINFP